jgi:FkbM family methyltransferase
MLIELCELYKKYHINPTGVIHLGASLGQEAETYHNHGLKVIWIEAIRDVYKQLCRNVVKYTGTISINACVSDKDGDIVDFNISNNDGQSSSIFEFGTHTVEHPGIVFTQKTKLHTARVDTLLKDRNIQPHEYDFVNLDIQGAELLALKGMDLTHIRYVYIEVNERELYKGCPLLPEIDAYLKRFDLHRVETKMTNWGWGDAFYIRKQREMNNAVLVPDHFRPKHPIVYPGDNDPDFERWFFENYKGSEGRTYLPIQWTAFYCKNGYGKQPGPIASLQKFLDDLDRSKKYFTIVQYDDGILNDLKDLDIKVFSMSGKPMDYCLPLLCQDHKPIDPMPNRDIFCSFVGRNTHPIRSEILKIKQPGWFITDKVQKMPEFCNTLARSVFTLCPRGYGPNSFRVKECMQYNSIPVIISDVILDPHGIDVNTYGVRVMPDQIKDLPQILSQVDAQAKRIQTIQAYEWYYTFKRNKEIIERECSV